MANSTCIKCCDDMTEVFSVYQPWDSVYALNFNIQNSANGNALVYESRNAYNEKKLIFVKTPVSPTKDYLYAEAFFLNALNNLVINEPLLKSHIPEFISYFPGNIGNVTNYSANSSTTTLARTQAEHVSNTRNFFSMPQPKTTTVIKIDRAFHIVQLSLANTGDIRPCLMTNAVENPITLHNYFERFRSYGDDYLYNKLNLVLMIYGLLNFKHNFIHNDLHAGNILFDKQTHAFTIIDYGRAYCNYPANDSSTWQTFKQCSSYYPFSNATNDANTPEAYVQRKSKSLKLPINGNRLIALNAGWCDIGGLCLNMFLNSDVFEGPTHHTFDNIKRCCYYLQRHVVEDTLIQSLLATGFQYMPDTFWIVAHYFNVQGATSFYLYYYDQIHDDNKMAFLNIMYELILLQVSSDAARALFNYIKPVETTLLRNFTRAKHNNDFISAGLSYIMYQYANIADMTVSNVRQIFSEKLKKLYNKFPFGDALSALMPEIRFPFLPLYGSLGLGFMYHSGQVLSEWFYKLPDVSRLIITAGGGHQPKHTKTKIGGRAEQPNNEASNKEKLDIFDINEAQIIQNMKQTQNTNYKKEESMIDPINDWAEVYDEKYIRDLPEFLCDDESTKPENFGYSINNNKTKISLIKQHDFSSTISILGLLSFESNGFSDDMMGVLTKMQTKLKGGSSKRDLPFIQHNSKILYLKDIKGKYRYTDKNKTHVIYDGKTRKVRM